MDIKLKILYVDVYTTVYHLDYTLRKLLLLRAAYCSRLWSAGKLQAAWSLCAYPVGNVITKSRQAEEKKSAREMNESAVERNDLLVEDVRDNEVLQSCYTGTAPPKFSGNCSASPVRIKK